MNKPGLLKCLLGLFFCTSSLCQFVTAQNTKAKDVAVTNSMIVLKILPERKGDTCVKVIFQTSQRIYRVTVKSKTKKGNELASKNILWLIESKDKHIPVLVKRANEKSDLILSVEKDRKK